MDPRSHPAATSAPGRPPRRRHSSIVLYLAAGLAGATAFGTPSFQASTQAINTAVTNAIGLADLNGDGNLDAFFAIDGGARLFFGDGRGQLTDSGQALASGSTAAIADVNGDGRLEVLAGTTLWLNDGAGRLTARTGAVASTEGGGLMAKLADLNGDGRPDVLAIRSYTSLRVYLNDGNGNFADTGQRLGDVSGQSELAHFVLTDVDRNGTIDAIVGGWRSITGGACPNRVWLNDGAGNFRDSGQLLDEEDRHVHGMAVGDFNGDGSPDLVVGLQTGASHARIYLNDGAGRFTAGQGLAGSRGEVVTTGDFDGNGTVDVFVGASNTTAGRLWLNDGSATFLDSGLSFAPG